MRLILQLLSLSKLYKQAMAIAIPESKTLEALNPLYINHPSGVAIHTIRHTIHGESHSEPVRVLDIPVCILHTESSTEREQWPGNLQKFVVDSFCSREAFLGVFN